MSHSLKDKHIALVVSAYSVLSIYICNIQPPLRIEDCQQKIVVLFKELLELLR